MKEHKGRCSLSALFKKAICSGTHIYCYRYAKISRRNHRKLNSGYLWENKWKDVSPFHVVLILKLYVLIKVFV